jgi:hypothetical protein
MKVNKTLFGLLGAGSLAAAWFLLPKDSKIKKVISDTVCQLTDKLVGRVTGKVTPTTNQMS